MKESLSKAIKTGFTIPMGLLEVTEVMEELNGLNGIIGNFSQYKIRT